MRRHAVAYSDFYNTRLKIHRIGSYTMLPLFASEWVLGDRLLNGTNPPGWMKPTHVGVASALGVLFTVNTVTGAWNLWDSAKIRGTHASLCAHGAHARLRRGVCLDRRDRR